MKWTDIYDIAFSLEEVHPEIEVTKIKFTDLHQLVLGLEDFDDDPKRSNERILEAIQAAWIQERK